MALLIWECNTDIRESISCETRIILSLEKISIDSNSLTCLGMVFSQLKSLISFSCEEFSLCWARASVSSFLIELLIVFANSYSIGFAFSHPSSTSTFSKSVIMSISLDLLGFSFCLLVDGNKRMPEIYLIFLQF